MTQTWPELEVATWQDTRDTFHMWTQIVGKIRLALEPMLNHWWNVTLYVSARGLTTSLMPTSSGGLEIEFDMLDEALVLRATDGRTQRVALEPRTVASFYEATMAALEALDVHVKISARPNEVVDATPFSRDTLHHSYDAAAVRLYWQQLLEARRVMQLFRRRF